MVGIRSFPFGMANFQRRAVSFREGVSIQRKQSDEMTCWNSTSQTCFFVCTPIFGSSYCWWTKSCTSWYGKYPIVYRALYIQTVVAWDFVHQQYFFKIASWLTDLERRNISDTRIAWHKPKQVRLEFQNKTSPPPPTHKKKNNHISFNYILEHGRINKKHHPHQLILIYPCLQICDIPLVLIPGLTRSQPILFIFQEAPSALKFPTSFCWHLFASLQLAVGFPF